MSDKDFDGLTAIVTGASRGIGEATARELAARGAAVLLLARDEAAIERIAGEIEAAGGRALAEVCDVAEWESVDAAASLCEERFGPPDILVNNAGLIEPIARLTESDPAGWDHTIDVNLKGVYHGLRAVLPGMIARRAGVVVNVSSGAATSPLEGWSHYCAAKAAALMLTRCAQLEAGESGVRVTGLSPGTVRTHMQVAIKASGINPVSELDPAVHIPPDWAAKAIAYLCTDAGAAYAGEDMSLRDPDVRAAIGVG
ncbi:MAG: SDR family oxidoreductase [Marivibrio sp.]|uniref:SDR family oxidoreductase n=1 Tax=Marivibrio sp. TaxID=2039719 RepID=UPI0032EFB118